MPNIRVFAPTGNPLHAKQSSFTANGRTYSVGAANFVDCPDFDGLIAMANGWAGGTQVGPTSARPTSPQPGAEFIDTTVGASVSWDGAAWRNTATGAVA